MRIYTKKGDGGESALFGGQTVKKNDPRLEAYGTLDELNSQMGLVRSALESNALLQGEFDLDFEQIQNELFVIGSHLATADSKLRQQLPQLPEESVLRLENRIDQMQATLPELKNFILPGGHVVAAQLHMARTIARRAERAIVAAQPEAFVYIYINRLSDYLFVAARRANHMMGQKDWPWKKPNNS